MKKQILSAVLVTAMAASLGACGSSSSSSSTAASGSTVTSATESTSSGAAKADVANEDEHTLSVEAWDANFNIPALEAAAADYKKNVDPDFNLNIIQEPQSSDIEDQITLAASSGDYSQLPDIVLFQDHYFHKYVTDYPDAWSDAINSSSIDWSDFGQEKLSYSQYNDEHWGVPVDNGTCIAAYRTDLLKEAGYTIDDLKGCSWDKFDEIGKAVYAKTGKYLLCMNGDGNDLPYIMLQAEGVSQFKDGKANFVDNDTMVQVINMIVKLQKDNVLYLANDWSDYTNQAIQGDMVAGVINGNWIIPTIEQVTANSGKWEITTLPTLKGGDGYASNGGSSLYITSNCKKTDLAVDFLSKTFGAGSTETYDAALKNGGVITCSTKAGKSDVYQQGVAYFNNQPIYAQIVEMGTHVKVVEQSDYHYDARTQVAAAIQNIINGADTKSALQDAQDQVDFTMGG